MSTDFKKNKIYFFAFMTYLLPLIFMGVPIFIGMISIFVEKTIIETSKFFLGSLFSLLPCGLIGIVLSSIGLIKSFKNKKPIEMGIIGIFIGLIYVFGILGLTYVVVLH